MEKWRPVRGYKRWYEVSDRGRVRSVDRWVHFSDGRVRFYSEHILARYKDWYGYLKVTLNRNSEDYRVHIHLLVAEAFLGKRPRGLQVRHKDGNPLHPYKNNLCYGTSKENHADALRHGTRRYGSLCSYSTLSTATITKIKNLRGKMTCKEIAELVRSSPSHVCNVQQGKRRVYHGTKKNG